MPIQSSLVQVLSLLHVHATTLAAICLAAAAILFAWPARRPPSESAVTRTGLNPHACAHRLREALVALHSRLLLAPVTLAELARIARATDADVAHILRHLAAAVPRLRTCSFGNQSLIFLAPTHLTASKWDRLRDPRLRANLRRVERMARERAKLQFLLATLEADAAHVAAGNDALRARFAAVDEDTERRRIALQLSAGQTNVRCQEQLCRVSRDQITILGTQIHNLVLQIQGAIVKLPTEDQIISVAAALEEQGERLCELGDLATDAGRLIVASAAPGEAPALVTRGAQESIDKSDFRVLSADPPARVYDRRYRRDEATVELLETCCRES